MTDTNVISMPTPLNVLAERYKASLVREANNREEWIEIKIEQCLILGEARAKFPSNIEFSVWLAQNGLDELGHQDRAAALNIARHLEIARTVMRNSESKSLRLIWQDMQSNHLTSAGRTDEEPHQLEIPAILTSVGKTDEDTRQPAAVALKVAANETTSVKQSRRSEGASSRLEQEHGHEGRIVAEWVKSGKPNALNRHLSIAGFGNLPKATVKKLAEFINQRRDSLPTPNATNAKDINLRRFWDGAPGALVQQFNIGNPDRNVRLIIEGWDDKIAPVIQRWRELGEPQSDAWYHMPRPSRAAPVQIDQDALRKLEEARMALEAVADIGLARDGHDQWPLPSPAPIRVYGLDIWPTKSPFYDWRAAYYAFHIWSTIDDWLALTEKQPHVRAMYMRNPLGPLFASINGPVGKAWNVILTAQETQPDQKADTRAPGKVLQGR